MTNWSSCFGAPVIMHALRLLNSLPPQLKTRFSLEKSRRQEIFRRSHQFLHSMVDINYTDAFLQQCCRFIPADDIWFIASFAITGSREPKSQFPGHIWLSKNDHLDAIQYEAGSIFSHIMKSASSTRWSSTHWSFLPYNTGANKLTVFFTGKPFSGSWRDYGFQSISCL